VIGAGAGGFLLGGAAVAVATFLLAHAAASFVRARP
jgi:hypothetical protein